MQKFKHLFYGVVTLEDPAIYNNWDKIADSELVYIVLSDGDVLAARKMNLEPIIEVEAPEHHRSLNGLAEKIFENNRAKGFAQDLPDDVNIDRNLMLIVGELAEAQEELRAGHTVHEVYYPKPKLPASLVAEVGVAEAERLIAAEGKPLKPEGFPMELADALIRLLGLMAELELDIDGVVRDKMEYNAGRPFRHGKSF